MKLIIAGSRTITSYTLVRDAVVGSGFWKKYGRDIEVVCGMAKGVDLLGLKFAKNNNLKWHEFPAEWDNLDAPDAVIKTRSDGTKYNVRAGIQRNIRMGEVSDGLLAIWDGKSRGTKHMIDWATANKLEVYVQII